MTRTPTFPCPSCRGRRWRKVAHEDTVSVEPITFTATVQGAECMKCGEVVLDGPALEGIEERAAVWLAEHGVRSQEAFRFMRKALGLRAADLADLLETTPETVSRWENGRHPIDFGAFAVLGSLVADRLKGSADTLERLRALRDPNQSFPEPVVLDLAS